MRNKLLLSLIIFFVIIPSSFWCKYESEISQCNSEIQKFVPKNWWKYIYNWSSIKSFEDFVCLQAAPETRVAQIALDLNFKEIDEEVDTYIKDLEAQKNRFFWEGASWNYFDAINFIADKVDEFDSKYRAACIKSLEETSECTNNFAYSLEEEQKSVWVSTAIEYLAEGWDCYELINIKKDIISSVSYNILLLNQAQVQKDQQTLYEQDNRTKYNKLIDIMMINLWYIERIWQKTPSLTKNPL